MGKSPFEQWQWNQDVAEFSHYHSNNGIFTTAEYRHNCKKKGQTQFFSGVGAQHQNVRAERSIQTIIYMAHNFMVYASLYWYERGSGDIYLWSLSVKYSVCFYNRFPRKESVFNPL